MSLLTLVILLLVGVAFWRLGAQRSEGDLRPQPTLSPFVTVADVAFEYSRAVLALDDVKKETKTRALRALNEAIIPLAGCLAADMLSSDVQDGVSLVLAQESGDAAAAVYVWLDLIRWARGQRLL